MSADVNRHVEELFAAPLKEFTSARNTKVAALAAAGQSEEAQFLRRLRRPPVSLWAVNQLARLVPEQVSEFVDLVQRARGDQLRDPRAAAEAMQAQRAKLGALTKRAAEAMTKAAYSASSDALGRISNTLLGAAVDQRLAEDLRRGRLTAELPAPGFEVLTGVGAGAALRALPGGRASRRVIDERRESAEAATRARVLAERERLAQEAQTARREATARAEAAERVGQEVQDLKRQLAEAQRRFLAARREAATAAKRVPRSTSR
jgi:cell division septum initiation protein DivIVA